MIPAIDPAAFNALRARLRAQAELAPPASWCPVLLDGRPIGVAAPATSSLITLHVDGAALGPDGLALHSGAAGDVAARTRLLDRVARLLRDHGLLLGWRDEPLDVRSPETAPRGEVLATIERAACRALGIATHAVHLNAWTADGRIAVARRADHKSVDPGRLDNLVGGMVAAGETELEALAREAWEEAGLRLETLVPVRGSLLREARPVSEGYMVETVQAFDLVLPAGTLPANQDGEVAEITLLPVAEVLAAIEAGRFTLEAALVTLEAIGRRAGIAEPGRGG